MAMERILKIFHVSILLLIFVLISCAKNEYEINAEKENNTDTDPNLTEVIGDNVHLRRDPYLESKIIKTLKSESNPVTILGRSMKQQKIKIDNGNKYSEKYWYKIRTKNGAIGWVFGKYIDQKGNRFSEDEEINVYLTENEYDTYIKDFKKFLILNKFVTIWPGWKRSGERFYVNKDMSVAYFPQETLESYDYEDLKQFKGNHREGRLKLFERDNMLPKAKIVFNNGEELLLKIVYGAGDDSIRFARFDTIEEASDRIKDMSRQ